jgi:hypothetical protein
MLYEEIIQICQSCNEVLCIGEEIGLCNRCDMVVLSFGKEEDNEDS